MKFPSFPKRKALVYLWLCVPLLGRFSAIVFVVLTCFKDRSAQSRSALFKTFLLLCCVYMGYLALIGLVIGPIAEAASPIGRNAPLLIVPFLSYMFFRPGVEVPLLQVFRASSVVLLAVFVFLAIDRFWNGTPRPNLLYKNSLNLVPTMLVPALICSMTIKGKTTYDYILGLAALLSAIVSIGAFCEARGVFFAIGVMITIRIIMTFFDKNVSRNKVWSAVVVALVSIVGASLVFYLTGSERLVNVAQTVTDGVGSSDEHSVNARYWMFKSGWTAFWESPVFGHGPQNRFLAAAEYFPKDVEFPFSHLHNEFVTHAVGGGIIAVLLLVVLIGYPLSVALRVKQHSFELFELGVYVFCAFAIVASINNVLFIDVSVFNFALTVAFYLVLCEPKIAAR